MQVYRQRAGDQLLGLVFYLVAFQQLLQGHVFVDVELAVEVPRQGAPGLGFKREGGPVESDVVVNRLHR